MADKLFTGNDYYFRVKAVNAEGESEPLETEKATPIKKKVGKYPVILPKLSLISLRFVKDKIIIILLKISKVFNSLGIICLVLYLCDNLYKLYLQYINTTV